MGPAGVNLWGEMNQRPGYSHHLASPQDSEISIPCDIPPWAPGQNSSTGGGGGRGGQR